MCIRDRPSVTAVVQNRPDWRAVRILPGSWVDQTRSTFADLTHPSPRLDRIHLRPPRLDRTHRCSGSRTRQSRSKIALRRLRIQSSLGWTPRRNLWTLASPRRRNLWTLASPRRRNRRLPPHRIHYFDRTHSRYSWRLRNQTVYSRRLRNRRRSRRLHQRQTGRRMLVSSFSQPRRTQTARRTRENSSSPRRRMQKERQTLERSSSSQPPRHWHRTRRQK